MSEEMKKAEVAETVVENAAAAAEEAAQAAEEKVETMDDYKEELEASYRRYKSGDIVTGTVVNVGEKDITVDFNYSAPGRIPMEEMSDDPAYVASEHISVGDSITATVLKTDDGAGNMLLSCKDANRKLAWEKLKAAMSDKSVIHGKISDSVKGGVVMFVEGIRGFIPASKLGTSYIEDTTPYVGQEIDVQVVEVDEEKRRVILSARELLRERSREKAREERSRRMEQFAVGATVEGTVEQLKDYGAFVDLGDGVSGLLHVSQISDKRLRHPNQVLKEGDKVTVRIIKVADGKISLSMREQSSGSAPSSSQRDSEDDGPRFYSDKTTITTGLGALLKGIKVD